MKKAIFLVILFSLISLWPFFKTGYFESDDGEWMVIRFTAFHQTLRSGQFPVRFVDRLNNNYGYPVLNFLYPLPFYLAEIPKLFGLGFVDSIKTIFVVSTILSSVLMYIALTQKFSTLASLSGAIIYLYSPYRFVDLYTRGSLGEVVAFAIIPMALLSIFKIEKNQKKYLPILAIAVAFLITAHNVIALFFLPLFIVTSVIFCRKYLKESLLAYSLGIFIASFFWMPALLDLKYVRLSQIKVSEVTDHLINFQNLILPEQLLNSNPIKFNPGSPQLGIVNIAVVVYALILQFSSKQKNKFVLLLIFIFAFLAFFMSNYSYPLWQIISFVDIIQFPWRLLSVEIFISAILTAYIVEKSEKKILLCASLMILAFIPTFPYTRPSVFTNRPDSYYSTNEDTTTVRSEYLPIWVKENKSTRADSKFEVDINTKLTSQLIKSAKYEATIDSLNDTQVIVNTIFFPGWQLKIDGVVQNIYYDSRYGLINFPLPKGEHKVIISYSKTPVHATSELLSLTALILTCIYFFKLKK